MSKQNPKVTIEVSARHLHLCLEDVEKLFGRGRKLTVMRELSQEGEFAANETVTLRGPKGVIDDVRVIGPTRDQTQVEISATDARALGIKAPVRLSGDLKGTPGAELVGPKGAVDLQEGVIVAERHIHMNDQQAAELGLKDGDKVDVDVGGVRDLLFENVPVRVKPSYFLSFHIDTDEANAAWLSSGDEGKIIVKK